MAVLYSLLAAAFEVLHAILGLYVWVLVISAVLSWLTVFDVVNTRNRFVHMLCEFCFRVTEPVLKPIRRFLPPMGGLDVSPIILIFAIWFLQSFIHNLQVALLAG